MIEQKFKLGDIVELKSGGPSMTVRGYEPKDGDEVVCEWFDKHTHCSKAFNQETLHKTSDITFSFTPIQPHNPNRF